MPPEQLSRPLACGAALCQPSLGPAHSPRLGGCLSLALSAVVTHCSLGLVFLLSSLTGRPQGAVLRPCIASPVSDSCLRGPLISREDTVLSSLFYQKETSDPTQVILSHWGVHVQPSLFFRGLLGPSPGLGGSRQTLKLTSLGQEALGEKPRGGGDGPQVSPRQGRAGPMASPLPSHTHTLFEPFPPFPPHSPLSSPTTPLPSCSLHLSPGEGHMGE